MIKRDMLVVRPKDVVSLFVDCRERICVILFQMWMRIRLSN